MNPLDILKAMAGQFDPRAQAQYNMNSNQNVNSWHGNVVPTEIPSEVDPSVLANAALRRDPIATKIISGSKNIASAPDKTRENIVSKNNKTIGQMMNMQYPAPAETSPILPWSISATPTQYGTGVPARMDNTGTFTPWQQWYINHMSRGGQ